MKAYLQMVIPFALLISACAPSPMATSPRVETATVVLRPSATVTPALTATLAPTPTLVATQTPAPITPPVELRCPTSPEVPLAELGLSPTSRLVVVPAEDRTRTQWALLGSDLVPKRLLSASFRDRPLSDLGISPDQRWFQFLTEAEESTNVDLWIGSMNSTKLWRAMTNLERPPFNRWMNDQTLILFDYPEGRIWPTTSARFNPFTLETTPLAPKYLDLGAYAFSPDAWQVIHLESFPYYWELYDFRTDTAKVVFPWMDTDRIQLPYSISLNWTMDGVSVALMDTTGFDLVVNLPPELLDKQDVPIQRVVLSGPSTVVGINWWSSDSGLIAINRRFGKWEGDPSGPAEFRLLDTSKWVLYDYCLPQDLIPGITRNSADERFLAWTVVGPNNSIVGTVVMELATGRRAWLPGWEVLGWGEVDENNNAP